MEVVCGRCGCAVAEEDLVPHGAGRVCEDCVMDLLSPAKACDPWAVKAATSSLGSKADAEKELRGAERAVYELVKARGRVDRALVPGLVGLPEREVARAFSVLRHMELLRGEMRPDRGVDVLLFDA